MIQQFTKFTNFYMPEGDGGGSKEPISRDGILSALNEDSDSKGDNLEIESDDDDKDQTDKTKELEIPDGEEKDGEDEDDKDNKEVDELKEIEDELKEPSEEDLELTTPVRKREILAKYPDIFKDFPSLEKSYYRELEYTKLLPTIQDAKDAVSAVNVLNNFEADLKEGKTIKLLEAVRDDDPNAFAKLADTYMENLASVDEKAYHHVLGNITKDIVTAMIKAGKTAKNTELQDAATVMYEFMFGNKEWTPKQRLAVDTEAPENEDRKKLAKEREDFETTKYTERQSELMNGVTNRITSVIDANIDKKEQMTPFVKKNAIKEVNEKLGSLIKADTRFQTIIKQLWARAKEQKYSRDSLNKIESAHVAKAKALLPTVIVSVKKEALKGINSRKNTEEKPNESKLRNSTASRSKEVDSTNDKNKPKPGESTLAFLSR